MSGATQCLALFVLLLLCVLQSVCVFVFAAQEKIFALSSIAQEAVAGTNIQWE